MIPELVCLTGLTDNQRSNFNVMKSLAQHTKLSAQTRMLEAAEMVHGLQQDEDLMFKIKSTPNALNGFKLPSPHVKLGKGREATVKNGTIMFKEKVLDPFEFREFVICYSVNQNPKYADDDRNDVDEAYDLLKTAAKTFGIKFSNEPIFIEVTDGRSLNQWMSALEKEKKNMKEGDQNDIMFFFLKPNEEKFYGDIKKFVAFNFNCPSQVTKRKLLRRDNKNAMSAASKIVMQMNVKIGHPLWEVSNSHPVWENNTVAVAGIASSKGKKGTTLAFDGSINRSLNIFFSDCKQIKGKETYSAALFEGFFTQWIQNWFMKNDKKLPKVLVVYREGLNEAQARTQAEAEIQGLLNTIETVKKKAKQDNYSPVISYILVNKKPNSRIFEAEKDRGDLKYYNPDPGSVIFEDLSQGFKEFHLASATVREGTCTPVSFKVLYENDEEFPLEAICELTYNQCYCYYNWTGSVRVPATLQNANKLAKLYS